MPFAYEVRCVDVSGNGADRLVARIGGMKNGQTWTMSAEEAIRKIESGEVACYVTSDGQSQLIRITVNSAGRKALTLAFAEVHLEDLPELRRCS